jgi:signal transduction histidine kinase
MSMPATAFDRQLELAAAAHDLRNRISIAGCELHELRSKLVRTRCETALVEVLTSTERSLAETSNGLEALLELMRLPLRVPESTAHATDLVKLTRQVIRRQKCPERVLLRSDIAQLTGAWNSARIKLVLGQVIANALDYSAGGSTVGVAIHGERGEAVVSVTDRGIGIPDADLPHVCETFFRARNVPDCTSGLGLGLATARLIVEQYGGTLQLESMEGSGTAVTIRLPVATACPSSLKVAAPFRDDAPRSTRRAAPGCASSGGQACAPRALAPSTD